MRVIGRGLFADFILRHPDAESSLGAWLRLMDVNEFEHFIGLRRTFGSADYVRPYTVFNIAGNKYRLIAVISYPVQTVSVERVLTHAEYDQNKWKK